MTSSSTPIKLVMKLGMKLGMAKLWMMKLGIGCDGED